MNIKELKKAQLMLGITIATIELSNIAMEEGQKSHAKRMRKRAKLQAFNAGIVLTMAV